MQSVRQEPIYHPDAENSPSPNCYLNPIQTYQSTGCETWHNRWITSSGIHADEGHQLHGKVLAQKAFDTQLRERHLGSIGESSQ